MLKISDKIALPPGRYVLAVSGGVDSMVLLDVLSRRQELKLTLAHFNHGIRDDSARDELLVAPAAKRYGLVLETGHGRLGPKTSEDQARRARYAFLSEVKNRHQAKAIITAHHQDDLLETAVINILRGTNRRGLVSLLSNPRVLRPLTAFSKKEILSYAREQKIEWREDTTNTDEVYLRNYLRRQVLSRLTDEQRKSLLKNINKVAKIQHETEQLIATISQTIMKDQKIDRSKYASLPVNLGDELMAFWLRQQGLADFDRRMLNRLSLGVKTAKAGAKLEAAKGLKLDIGQKSAHFSNR